MNTAPAYFVKVDLGKLGAVWLERNVNETDRETLIRDLIDGQIEDPLQVIEVEIGGMAVDVSESIAREIADRVQNDPISEALIAFVHDNASPALARELRSAA
jgi:hypothetical protein